ncbi:Mycofactocin system glycosyltransferase [Olavius sp. associated proteobacterium Delta 1]|nr:Mycofactocin system glycosyltransferase [Olavius sp. associated proteobacterium Delta 1]
MLTYRLRNTVSVHETDEQVILTLSYPLKAICIHLRWRRLFKRFSHHEMVSFETIRSISEIKNPDELEFFLNNLVRKGFLQREGVSPLSDYPFVSVIIPVRNRPDDIAACLQSLKELTYPDDELEIIVVDDASTDHTLDIASRFEVRLIPLRQHKQAAYCRNIAARRARGELLAFLDSDCLADSVWLRELVAAFKDQTLCAVGGVVESYFNENGLDRYEKVRSSLNVSSRFRRSTENDPFFYLPACNLLIRRDTFLKVNGFREELFVGEDVDFCWRMRERGYHFEYRTQGRVFHKHRNKLTSFCLRRFEYGTSEPLLNRLHPKKKKQMVCPPLALVFWAGLMLSLVLNYLPLLGISGAAIIADGVKKRLHIRKKGLPIKTSWLLLSVLRSYAAFSYHICSFVSRYYLFLSLIILPIAPAAATVILILHLTAGTVDYVTTKPQLNPISFLFYFTLEQLSYQLGVWWGCFKTRCFRPVNPIVAGKISV